MSEKFELATIGYALELEGQYSLHINEAYRKGLKELNGFSHAFVIFWATECNRDTCRSELVVHEPYKSGPERIGVFATRSEYRPNPFLLTVVPILNINEKTGDVLVAYHDAYRGTPVVDIKPYLPGADRVENVRVGKWAENWPDYYEKSADFDWSGVFNF